MSSAKSTMLKKYTTPIFIIISMRSTDFTPFTITDATFPTTGTAPIAPVITPHSNLKNFLINLLYAFSVFVNDDLA